MVTDCDADTDVPSLQTVLDAVDDPAARTIIAHLKEPMTASQLAAACAGINAISEVGLTQ